MTTRQASARLDALPGNAWGAAARADEALARLGLAHKAQAGLASLSGGERKRLALAAALARAPDVLLLDEPTNHLDAAGIRWLERQLRASGGGGGAARATTAVVITHDRAFLDRVATRVVELDVGRVYSHQASGTAVPDVVDGAGGEPPAFGLGDGGSMWRAYLDGRTARLANDAAVAAVERAKLKREAIWMSRAAKARQMKSRERIGKYQVRSHAHG